MDCLLFQCRHRYESGFELDAEFSAAGGVTALFGPSGSGKSTVLAIIAGLLHPQRGLVRWGDTVWVDTRANLFTPPEARRIGLVSQDHLLFPHLTVEENLRYGMRRRSGRGIDFARVAEVLELDPLLDRAPRTLSGGQRQRTALGRAILRGPELLLMDEPLAALDADLKDRILLYLERAVAEWRIPTLFVSHDQNDVRRLAQRVIVLEGGRVVDAGPIPVALDRAVISTMKSRPGPVNLLRLTDVRPVGRHWEGAIGTQAMHLTEAPRQSGSVVHVTFRPSDVTLSRATVPGLSVRNQLLGTVRQVIVLPDRAFVAIDVGQFLWAELTPEAVRDLGLQEGSSVHCLIKSTAVAVIHDE